MIWRILLSIPLWLAYAGTALVLDVIGVPVVAVLAWLHVYRVRASDIWPRPVNISGEMKGGLKLEWPRWAWLWSNEEDGITGPGWYTARNPSWSWARVAFVWSALRNPSNNMRFIPGINPVIDPKRVEYLTYYGVRSTQIVYTWQGIFSGVLVTFPLRGGIFRFWIGWKLKPEDRQGVADSDMRKPRCGFATQFKRIG